MKNVALLIMAAALSAALCAAPLQKEHVPADTKWVFHIDFEAFGASQFGQQVVGELRTQLQPKIDSAKHFLGSDPTRDIHSLTVFGPDADETNAVAMIRGQFDQNKLLALLALNPAYSESIYKEKMLYHWQDEKRNVNQVGAFAADNLIVISQSIDAVQGALDAIAGEKLSLNDQTDAPLWSLTEGTQGAFLVAAADELQTLTQGQDHAAVLRNSRMMTLVADEADGNLRLSIHLEANNVEAAVKVEQVVRGMMAFAALQAQYIPELEPLLQAGNLTRTDALLAFQCHYPSDKLFALILQHAQNFK